MGKGEETRQLILGEGLSLASELGFEGVTIGVLAQRAGLSKSGLYAHFRSKEALQCAVLVAASESFVDLVVAPALKRPRGIPRIEELFEGWMRWSVEAFPGGCPFIAAATELDDRPGPVREKLLELLEDLLGFVERAAAIAAQEGQFRRGADPAQFAFEFWAVLVAHHHYRRLFKSPQAQSRAQAAFRRLIDDAR